ncbi:MAG: ribosome silencing factor [Candidatus Omnitrophota bacterium]
MESKTEPRSKAVLIAETAKEKKAEDIVLLDVSRVSAFCDYFIIMTANNTRQVKAISDEIEGKLEEEGYLLWHREGERESSWLLLDFGNCVVHIFDPEARRFYGLESLWGDVPRENLG